MTTGNAGVPAGHPVLGVRVRAPPDGVPAGHRGELTPQYTSLDSHILKMENLITMNGTVGWGWREDDRNLAQ